MIHRLRTFYTKVVNLCITQNYKNDKRLFKLLVFGGSEITYQSWYGVDPLTLKNDRKYNFAGEIYNSNNELLGFYDNQVDNYKQDHYQLHWNQTLGSNWSINRSFNYTRGKGYFEQFKETLKHARSDNKNIWIFRAHQNSKITIYKNVKLDRGVRLLATNNSRMSIGPNTAIGLHSVFNGGDDITIGKSCLISGFVSVSYTHLRAHET